MSTEKPWIVEIKQEVAYRPTTMQKVLEEALGKHKAVGKYKALGIDLTFPREGKIEVPLVLGKDLDGQEVMLAHKRYLRDWVVITGRVATGLFNNIDYSKKLSWKEAEEGSSLKRLPETAQHNKFRTHYIDPAVVAKIMNDPKYLDEESVCL